MLRMLRTGPFVHLFDFASHGGAQAHRVTRSPQRNGHRARPRVLKVRHIQFRRSFDVQPEVLDVSHYAYDFARDMLARIRRQPHPDWIFVGPELASHRFVDDRNGRARLLVALCEFASRYESYAHNAKVIGSDRAIFGARLVAGF